MKKFKVQLKGITPLLLHHDDVQWADDMAALIEVMKSRDKNSVVPGDDRTPPIRWRGCLYHDGEHIAIPTDNILSMWTTAGSSIAAPGKTRGTLKKKVPACVLFDDAYAKLDIAANGSPRYVKMAEIEKIRGDFPDQVAGVKALGFDLDVRRAKVQTAKHVRVRPRFNTWSLRFCITVTLEEVSSKLQDLADYGGHFVGLCDWRPGAPMKPGPFGRHSVQLRAVSCCK